MFINWKSLKSTGNENFQSEMSVLSSAVSEKNSTDFRRIQNGTFLLTFQVLLQNFQKYLIFDAYYSTLQPLLRAFNKKLVVQSSLGAKM